MRTWTLALLLAVLPACGLTPQPRGARFVLSEYQPYAAGGNGAIQGQAFLKTKGGDVKYGAGNPVYLDPVTSYSTEWYERRVLGEVPLEDADPRTSQYHWQTVADGFGNFSFEGLAPGEYYVACPITWHVDTYTRTGGMAHARVTVRTGETTRTVVTR